MLFSTTDFQSEAAPSPVLGWFLVVIFPSLLPATLHSVCSPLRLASVRDGSVLLQPSLGDSNPEWLSPAVTPHPNVDLIKPAAVASSIPAVSHSSLVVSKAVGQGWGPVRCIFSSPIKFTFSPISSLFRQVGSLFRKLF